MRRAIRPAATRAGFRLRFSWVRRVLPPVCRLGITPLPDAALPRSQGPTNPQEARIKSSPALDYKRLLIHPSPSVGGLRSHRSPGPPMKYRRPRPDTQLRETADTLAGDAGLGPALVRRPPYLDDRRRHLHDWLTTHHPAVQCISRRDPPRVAALRVAARITPFSFKEVASCRPWRLVHETGPTHPMLANAGNPRPRAAPGEPRPAGSRATWLAEQLPSMVGPEPGSKPIARSN